MKESLPNVEAPKKEMKTFEVGETVDNISFRVSHDRKRRQPVAESSAMDRKMFRIDMESLPQGMKVNPDQPYRVKILSDSKPSNPKKGYYLVQLVPSNVTEEDWRHAEDILTRPHAEAESKRRLASKEIYEETGLTRDQRRGVKTTIEYAEDEEGEKRIKSISQEQGYAMGSEEILEAADIDLLVEQALDDEGSAERRAEDLRNQNEPLMSVLEETMRSNLRNALRKDRELEKKITAYNTQEAKIRQKITASPTPTQSAIIRRIHAYRTEAKAERRALLEANPEAFVGLHLRELKEYKRNLTEGRLVRTAYVEEQGEKVMTHLEASKPVFIYGHLGAGKTELALTIGREYSEKFITDDEKKAAEESGEAIDKTPLVIAGSKKMGQSELYGYQVLTLDEIKEEELASFVEMVTKKFNTWKEENPKASEQEVQLAHDRYLQTYLTQFKSGTISSFLMGPFYKAAEEGRVLIVDEVNAIPHEVLISMNHLLTRKVGDVVNVQQDSGKSITIKEGYGVIMTGNLNQGDTDKYEREDMDPAWLSRLYKLEHDYLPQKTSGTLEEASLLPEMNQQFHVLMARVMDRNGNVNIPEGAMKKLYSLAQAARVIQDVFAGRDIPSHFQFRQGGSRGIKTPLRESVLSLRALDNIISQWQSDAYQYELDYYIADEFVNQATQPTERAYLYQLLNGQFGFFQGQGWEQNPDYGYSGAVTSFDIKLPKNSSRKPQFMTARETVKALFGDPPQRDEYPVAYLDDKDAQRLQAKKTDEPNQEDSLRTRRRRRRRRQQAGS